MVETRQPNIVWISFEDTNPFYGCYGDPTANTPNLDALASEGLTFTNCYSTAGVCAPARSAVITGMYPTSIGTHHMRTTHPNTHSPALPTPYSAVTPHYVKCFSEYLRAAGYYCTNNVKTDYQFDPPGSAWDELSESAHWRNRPEPGQPFFAVFNPTRTHESGMWEDHESEVQIDPAAVRIPPYFPDSPKVRASLARMHGNIARSDQQLGELLSQLEEDGLAENTIVMHWSDHGPLPRGKRWPYDSGIRVPLIIRWPAGAGNPGAAAGETLANLRAQRRAEPAGDPASVEATVNAAGGHMPRSAGGSQRANVPLGPANGFTPGGVTDRLVSTVDLGPTVLSLAGVPVPPSMQGQPFLGPQAQPEREYVYATRDRYDTSYDMVRAVRDRQFKLIENHYLLQERLIWVPYRNRHPIMQELYDGYRAGSLTTDQQTLFEDRAPVELYDTWSDPYELHNLASEPAHADTVKRLRTALSEWRKAVGDMGSVSESQMVQAWYPGGIQPETEGPILMSISEAKYADEPESVADVVAPALCQIQCSTQGASIEYALGTEGRWMLYTGPIRLQAGSHMVRARAFRIGYKPSPEKTLTLTVR
jgi:N-sulfoglucosamine sulfohydrolase